MTDTIASPVETEALSPKGMYQELVAEYNHLRDDQTRDVAARQLDTEVVPSLRIIDAPRWAGAIGFGTTRSAYSRLEHKILAEAATASGTRSREGDMLDDQPGSQLVWAINPRGNVEVRYSDEDGSLRASIAEVCGRMSEPFDDLAEQLKEGSMHAVTSKEFSLNEDEQDVVLVFMGLDTLQESPVKAKAAFMQRLYQLPLRMPGDAFEKTESKDGVYVDENGALVKILAENYGRRGIYRGMYFETGTKKDPSETSFRLGVEIDAERSRLQKAEASDDLAEPFIYTRSGEAIIESLAGAGLTASSRMREILFEHQGADSAYSARYGNGYAELSREAAKYVGVPHRDTEALFEGKPEDVIAAFDGMNIDDIQNEPARVLMGLLKQALASDRDIEQSELPAYSKSVRIRENNCKDFETAYKSATGSSYINNVASSHGNSTPLQVFGPIAVNLKPTVFKGVRIPAGGLFQVYKTAEGAEEFVFARMSSLAFSEVDAQDAFTWQYMETVTNTGHVNRETLQKVEEN